MVLCIVRRRVTVASRSIRGVARLALKIVSVLSISHDTSEGGLTFIQVRYTVHMYGLALCMVWHVVVRWLFLSIRWYCVGRALPCVFLAWLFIRTRA